MSTIGKIAVATLGTLLLGTTAASAATVSRQNGAVFINMGKGFQEIAQQAELSPGHQVMVRPGGSASIAYAGNCVVRVGSGIWWVQAASPCTDGATEIDFTGRMNQATQPPDQGGGAFVMGGLIIAGGVTAGILIYNNDKPASP